MGSNMSSLQPEDCLLRWTNQSLNVQETQIEIDTDSGWLGPYSAVSDAESYEIWNSAVQAIQIRSLVATGLSTTEWTDWVGITVPSFNPVPSPTVGAWYYLVNTQTANIPNLWSVTQPPHGSVTMSGTSLTYTPASGYKGIDSFTYTLKVGSYTSSPGIFTVWPYDNLDMVPLADQQLVG